LKLIRRSLTLACFSLLAVPAWAPAAPSLPLGHAGRWVTDQTGRVVVIHGVNMVYKRPPYDPASTGFGDDDAAFLESSGFNAVRVGVIWKAVEPQPGIYDDAYLSRIAGTVAALERHGIFSMLDFHQDLLNEKFSGEGFPDWAILDGGLPAQPVTGFPFTYATSPGLNAALAAFYANRAGPGGVGIGDRFAATWRHVAQRFAADRALLGYDLFNEPWPGNTTFPVCYTAPGCPAFERGPLTAMQARPMRAIRSVDRTHLLWYEPSVTTQAGTSKYTGPNPTADPRAGMSFHSYCLMSGGCPTYEESSIDEALARADANGDTSLLTEWGATGDRTLIDRMVALSDRKMVSWMWWHYCGCQDPTTDGPGDTQAIVLDPARPPTGANLKLSSLRGLVEPYPQTVAGTPSGWHFDPASGAFELRYKTARADRTGSFGAGSLTEVATPGLAYPNGYAAQVQGGAIVSPRGAGVLEIAACPGAGAVTVAVKPSGPSGGSCQARLRVAITPHSARLGTATTFRIRVLAVLGSFRRPVAGATVSFAGRQVRTDASGRATVHVTVHRQARSYVAVARAAGFATGRAGVRIAGQS
jgi:endoglycosylceramidase